MSGDQDISVTNAVVISALKADDERVAVVIKDVGFMKVSVR